MKKKKKALHNLPEQMNISNLPIPPKPMMLFNGGSLANPMTVSKRIDSETSRPSHSKHQKFDEAISFEVLSGADLFKKLGVDEGARHETMPLE